MYKIQLTERPLGYSVSSARKGANTRVLVSGATSTEDGDLHIKYLSGFPQTVLTMLENKYQPSDIKSMVVLISKDLMAKIYINEVEIYGQALIKAKQVEKGQSVGQEDISGFESIQLRGIEFTKNHAYFCILPVGWDKAYIFDFSPLDDHTERKIEYDVEKLLGSYFSYLSFASIHKISASNWNKIISQNWFPFYALKVSTIESIVNYAGSEWSIDELIDQIDKEALTYIDERKDMWMDDENLSPFVCFLDLALSRHIEKDFVSSSSIIYPKIEALIRKDFVLDNPKMEGRQQKVLINHITEKTLKNVSALTTFIPDKFKRYLEECYFKDFDINATTNIVSRHSVSHGESNISEFDKKASLLGLLIFSQIATYIQQSSNTIMKSKKD